MGRITTVETQKNRVLVSMDGVSFVRLSQADYDALPLHEDDDIDEGEYLDRLAAIQSPRAYGAALDMLGRRDMSAGDMSAALTRKGFVRPAIEATIARLTENRLLDDARYANRFIELRSSGGLGRYALAQKLRAKGIDPETAQSALEQVDEEQQLSAAVQWAERLRRRYEGQPRHEVKAKLSQALARRGFAWDTISAALERALPEEEW